MRRLTLTFDNGPTPGATERILDILAERKLKATFFVIGRNLADREGRRLVERAHAQGHWIGNHTQTHEGPLGLLPQSERAEREIDDAQRQLGTLAHPDKYFRPVGGGRLGPHVLNRAAVEHLIANEYSLVTWNNVPRDWVEPKRDWVRRALEGMAMQEWSLIVLHDFALADMMDTLGGFLDQMERGGVEIVQTFPESCVPIRRGVPCASLEGLVAD